MSLAVAIVNYRTAALTVDCLASVEPERATVPGLRALVVDNASGDGSAEAIAAAIDARGWRAWASALALERNGGYSAGNNVAIRVLRPGEPRYVLLLNPDTRVRAGALRALLRFMEAHPGAGIAGSRLEDDSGAPQVSAFRFVGPIGELESTLRLGPATTLLRRHIVRIPPRDAPHRADWVSGAAMLVRPEVFDRIGLLDEGYFLYFEDVDFCLRARRAGFECWHVPESRVVHLVSRATGVCGRDRPEPRPAYWFASRRRYYLKNFGPLRAIAADIAWISGFSLWRIRRALQGKPDGDPPGLLGDFIRHSVLVRGAAR